MKKFYGILLCLALMAFKTNVQAQRRCAAVTPTIIQPDQQSGNQYCYGVKVSLAQPYTQDVTVTGNLYEVENPSPKYLFSLTISAGQLSAQTATNYISINAASTAGVEITSISPCPPTLSETLNTMGQEHNDYL